jgi:hypothetical protein
MNPRVKAVSFQRPHFLILTFSNNERKRFSFEPYIRYLVDRKLENEVFAEKVYCVNGTVAWDDMIDFDPDTLYLEAEPLTDQTYEVS